jgi:hypothetical protein
VQIFCISDTTQFYEDVASSLLDQAAKRSVPDEASTRIRLAQRYESVLGSIRSVKGFEHFLMPKPFSMLASASKGGPVVLINVHDSRCDALVVCSPPGELIHVHLSKLSQADVIKMHQQFLASLSQGGMRERANRDDADGSANERGLKLWTSPESSCARVLSRLWSSVVQPILEAIEEKVSRPSRLSRVWLMDIIALRFCRWRPSARDVVCHWSSRFSPSPCRW